MMPNATWSRTTRRSLWQSCTGTFSVKVSDSYRIADIYSVDETYRLVASYRSHYLRLLFLFFSFDLV
ncbi:Uncharacterized protein APZ42_000077 [Daphnia magna]|uniref:Uncharacterized protein n=1 Tax=Daphnia magna TaxID=35525 RepID=A0A164JXS5_9CRUS|nr:Uncharacterized protein APZ42_000077 [Daphnia magna]